MPHDSPDAQFYAVAAMLRLGSQRTRQPVQFHVTRRADPITGSSGGQNSHQKSSWRFSSELVVQDFAQVDAWLHLDAASITAHAPITAAESTTAAADHDAQLLRLLHYALAREKRVAVVSATVYRDGDADGDGRTEFRLGVLKAKSRVLIAGQPPIQVLQLQLLPADPPPGSMPHSPATSATAESALPSYYRSTQHQQQSENQPTLINNLDLLPFMADGDGASGRVLDWTRQYLETTLAAMGSNGGHPDSAARESIQNTLGQVTAYLETVLAECDQQPSAGTNGGQLREVLSSCEQLLLALRSSTTA